jgi:CRISPR/Cas system-associated protein Cas10 (large subunit of type III CRISPR-Cas system)
LSNFALHVSGKVVESFDGQLIYAGGDDVLAMLPASHALPCAYALRCFFRGESPPEYIGISKGQFELHATGNGFVNSGVGYPLMMPGTEADVSCGIAIGHCEHPLQALVKEAQAAEKRAKNDYERSAFSISLLKRSGEIIQWGSKWESPAIALYDSFTKLSEQKLSGRFAYALAELLKPYRLEDGKSVPAGFGEIVMTEFSHVVKQQGDGLKNAEERDEFVALAQEYLSGLKSGRWGDFVNLFLASTFINRPRGDE